ncbi:MAG: hypothetical protein LBD27_06705, partial [Tannerella sp.]|nr:hypothetical protein [Tannerella sp.]
MNEKKSIPAQHNCLEHLDRECRCELCGNVHHTIVKNSNGSGTGEVIEWCSRCHKVKRYYDNTGAIIESSAFYDTSLDVEMRSLSTSRPKPKTVIAGVSGVVSVFSFTLFYLNSDFLYVRMSRGIFNMMGVFIIMVILFVL